MKINWRRPLGFIKSIIGYKIAGDIYGLPFMIFIELPFVIIVGLILSVKGVLPK